MSTSANRIFIGSYESYKDDLLSGGESANNFRFNIDNAPINVKGLQMLASSLLFLPSHPNIPPYESVLKMTTTISATNYVITLNIPTTIFYRTVYDSTGTNPDLITELNRNSNYSSTPSLPTDFTTDVGTWAWSDTIQRLIFTPVSGASVVINDVSNNSYRRLGIPSNQIGTAYTNASPLTCQNTVLLLRTQVVYITLPTLISDSIANVNKPFVNSILDIFPITNPAYGSVLPYSPSIPTEIEMGGVQLNDIQVYLLDDQFQPILFDSNCNFVMGFDIIYEHEKYPNREQQPQGIRYYRD